MNKQIAIILRDLCSAPYLDRTCGLVQTFDRVIEGDNGISVVKRIPVTTSASFQECNTSLTQFDMIPNSKYKGMLYFEDGGITGQTPVRNGIEYISRIRLVCWLNTKLIKGEQDPLLAGMIMADIIRKLGGNPFNSAPFTRITVQVANIPVQDKAIFKNYDYSEQQTQYLMAPFAYFALDLNVSFAVPNSCLSNITVNPNLPKC